MAAINVSGYNGTINNLTVLGTLTAAGYNPGAGNLAIGGNLSVAGTTTSTGLLTASNNAAVGGNLAVTGNSTIGGSLTVTGALLASTVTKNYAIANLSSNQNTSGGSTVLFAAGDVTIGGSTITYSTTTGVFTLTAGTYAVFATGNGQNWSGGGVGDAGGFQFQTSAGAGIGPVNYIFPMNNGSANQMSCPNLQQIVTSTGAYTIKLVSAYQSSSYLIRAGSSMMIIQLV